MKVSHARYGILAAMMIVGLSRCGADSTTRPQVVSITLDPPSATLRVGATVQLTATTRVDGGVTSTEAITFSSNRPAVVSVTSQGLLRALSVGSATITARITSGATASGEVTVVAGLPFTISKTAGDNQIANAGTAVAIAPTVTVRDSAGNLLSAVPVSFALAIGGGTLVGTQAITNDAGVASLTSWTLGSAGANAVTATVATLTPVTFSATSIPPPQPKIVISNSSPLDLPFGSPAVAIGAVQVSNGGTGTLSGLTLGTIVYSSGGTGWLSATLSGAIAPATVTLVASAASLPVGVYTAAVPLSAAGTVNGSDTIRVSLTIVQSTPRIIVITQPAATVSGAVFATQPVLRAVDGAGALITTYNGPFRATIQSGAGTLGGTTTINAVGGIGTFTDLKITGSGLFVLAFASDVPQATPTASQSFQVAALPATQLAIATQPSGATIGGIFAVQPVVEVRDANGAIVGSSNAQVTVSLGVSSVGGGSLSGTTTINAVNGIARFTDLRISGPGSYALVFNSGALTSATSAPLPVTTPTPVALSILTPPGGAVPGSPLTPQPVVRVIDANGVLVSTASNAVTATLVGPGTLSGTMTVSAVNGIATFTNLSVSGAGSYSITFSSIGLTPVTSLPFTVAPLPATQLAVGTHPGGALTGALLSPQPVVLVRDATNGTVGSAANAVTAVLIGAGGTLSGTTTVNAVNGVATFTNLVIAGAGTYTLSFTSSGLTSATSAPITIAPLPAALLAVATQPAGSVTGTALAPQPIIQVRDVNNGIVTGATNAVTATLIGAGGTLSGATTVNAVNGVATFSNLVVTGVGSYTLAFTSAGLPSATSGTFVVTAPAASALAIATQPSGGVSGITFVTQPVIQVRDAAANVVAGATNAVTATLVGPGGTLGGTTTINAVNGVATFTNLFVTGLGNYTITFSAAGLTPAASASITITPAPATQLAVVTQPVGALSGAVLATQPVVQVRDAANGVVVGATDAITATLVGLGGTLTGATTVNAVNGVATFSNLKVAGGGSYTLTFSATGLASATSSAFTMTVPPPAGITLVLGTAASMNGVTGANLSIPIVANMSNAQGQNLASLTFNVTWDKTKFDYISSANGSFGSSPLYAVNEGNVANGVLSVSILDTRGFSTGAPTILTLTLVPKASVTNSVVTAAVSAAGSDLGNAIPNAFIAIRSVAVSVP